MRLPPASSSRREGVFAALVVILWSAGALLARQVGIWVGIGGTAVLLGTISVLRGAGAPGLLRPSPVRLLVGLAAGLAMSAATYPLFALATRVLPGLASDVRQLYGAFQAMSLTVSLLVLVPVILAEEVLWRGLVQGALARHVGSARAALIGAVLYALAHLPFGSPALGAAALGCGLIWGLLRARTGNLVAPFVAHLVWDLSVLVLFPLTSPA